MGAINATINKVWVGICEGTADKMRAAFSAELLTQSSVNLAHPCLFLLVMFNHNPHSYS